MYGTHTMAFQRIFVRMKIIALIFIRFSYVSLIRNSVTGPLHLQFHILRTFINHNLYTRSYACEEIVAKNRSVNAPLQLHRRRIFFQYSGKPLNQLNFIIIRIPYRTQQVGTRKQSLTWLPLASFQVIALSDSMLMRSGM